MVPSKCQEIGRFLNRGKGRKPANITKRLLSTSTQEDDQPSESGGYVLSKKERRALRIVANESDEGNLQTTLDRMKQESKIQEAERNPLPWHSLLLHPSRALWRSSPKPPPDYLLDTQFKIIKAAERTPKQLRRTYDRIVLSHTALAERRERERRRMVNGAGHAVTSLEAKKQGSADRSKTPVYYQPEYSLSSLKYRLVPNYSITKRILAETQSLLGKEHFQPQKILDVGIGAGSATAAALDFSHENDDRDIEWIHGVDPSQSMRDSSNILLSQVLEGHKFSKQRRKTRITFSDSVASSGTNDDVTSGGGSFDLALCSYTLTEIPSVAANLSMAAVIWEKLGPGGVAIFIEPGTPDGFNSLRSVRSMLLDCCPPEEEEMVEGNEECHVIAPCTHNGTCPMVRHQRNFFREAKSTEFDVEDGEDVEDDDDNDDDIDVADSSNEKGNKATGSETDVFNSAFCSFVHGMPGSSHKKQKKQGEKFSYLVVQKRIAGTSELDNRQNPFKDVSIRDLLKKTLDAGDKRKTVDEEKLQAFKDTASIIEDEFLDSEADRLGLELVRGENRKDWGRLIRAPIKKKGHVIIDYCAATKNEEGENTGRIVRSKVTRSQGKTAPGMYLSSRKSRWGGLWPDLTSSSKSSSQ